MVGSAVGGLKGIREGAAVWSHYWIIYTLWSSTIQLGQHLKINMTNCKVMSLDLPKIVNQSKITTI